LNHENFNGLQCHPSLERVCMKMSLWKDASVVEQEQEQQSVIQKLSMLSTLKSFILNGSVLSTVHTVSLDTTRYLCQSRSLTKLVLLDLNLTEDHLVTMAQQVAFFDVTSTPSTTTNETNPLPSTPFSSLQTLRVSSIPWLGQRGWDAISCMVSFLQNFELHITKSQVLQQGDETDNELVTPALLRLVDSLKTSETIQSFKIRSSSSLLSVHQAIQNSYACHNDNKTIRSAFVTMLESQYTLEIFDVLGLSSTTETSCHFWLALNTLGRRHLMKNEGVTRNEWIQILSRAVQLDSLKYTFYFLSVNPSVMAGHECSK